MNNTSQTLPDSLQSVKIIRVSTAGLFQHIILKGQLKYLSAYYDIVALSAPDKELDIVGQREGVRTIGVPMEREIAPFKDIAALFRLWRVFRREKPLIIHASTPKGSLLAMIAGYFARVPVRLLTPTGYRFVGLSGMKRKIVIALEKLTCRFATDICPESNGVIKTIKEYNITARPVQLIGKGSVNGVDTFFYNKETLDPGKLADIRGSVGYDPANRYLLFVGRVVKDKGISELLRAFSQLGENIRLIVLGPVEMSDPVQPDVLEILKTDPRIIHIDWTDEVRYYMAIADMLIHPSYREGLPNVLLQAGSMECPVVCSDINGNSDIVTDHETGVLFRPRDEKELLAKVQWALEHPGEMKEYAQNLRNKVTADYDQQVVQEALKSKYAELAGRISKGSKR